MSKNGPDILLIRKYLNGELDARAMHRLERQAQDDPFLMDVLEGYEQAGDQHANMDEISNRLRRRIALKDKRIIAWRLTAVAASVLVLIIVGGIGLPRLQHAVPQNLAQASKPASAPDQHLPVNKHNKNEVSALKPRHAGKTANILQPEVVRHYEAQTSPAPIVENAVTAPDSHAVGTDTGDTMPLSEMVVVESKKREAEFRMLKPAVPETITGTVTGKDDGLPIAGASVKIPGTAITAFTNAGGNFIIAAPADKRHLNISSIGYADQQVDISPKFPLKITLLPANIPGGAAEGDLAGNTNSTPFKGSPPDEPVQRLQGKVAGVTTTAAPRQQYNSAFVSPGMITGRVIGKDDGLPLPGVSVKVAGTDKETQTDAGGRFNLQVGYNKYPKDSNKTSLIIGTIGYQTLKISADNPDSLKTIAMTPSSSSLSEVVVAGFNGNNEGMATAIVGAHPKDGWNNYRKYLKSSAVSADGKTGTVKVSVTISGTGDITAIKLLNGLSPAADKKAATLINDGPGWIGSSTNRSEKVTVRIKFVK